MSDTPFVVSRRGEYSVDDALSHIGYGTTQKLLLVILGAAYATCSANAASMLFIEPNVRCDWKLSKTREAALSAALLFGMAVGSNVWGCVSDKYGRKVGASLSLLAESIAGFAASIAPNYPCLCVARALVGIGAGGSSNCFAMYAEFLPPASRGYRLCAYQVFWALGWRVLAAITSITPLLLVPLVLLLPESPRFLVVVGQYNRASIVLRRIAYINRGTLPDGFLLSEQHAEEEATSVSLTEQFQRLFSRSLLWVTPVLWFLAVALGVGYFAIMFLTAIVHDEEDASCNGSRASLDDSAFSSILVDAFAELPGVILALFTIERLGRIRSLLVSWSGCWVAMTLLLLFPCINTASLFGARLAIIYANVFIFAVAPELYPSQCRCLGVGIVSSLTRFGGMISPLLVGCLANGYGLKAVYLFCGGLFVVADMTTLCLLPNETAGKEMLDFVQPENRNEETLTSRSLSRDLSDQV